MLKSAVTDGQGCNTGSMTHFTISELEAGIDRIIDAPSDSGVLAQIVRRPAEDEREVLETGQLTLADGLVGDRWKMQAAPTTVDGVRDPENQITVMSAQAVSLIAGDQERWQLAGDQLYVDFDISQDNLPAGTRLSIGEAVIEVSATPHTGCQKFSRRFGVDALRFVNSEAGRKLRLRGLNVRVVVPGTIRRGDPVRKQA
jgi:MOSC domain-containing protein YiiM